MAPCGPEGPRGKGTAPPTPARVRHPLNVVGSLAPFLPYFPLTCTGRCDFCHWKKINHTFQTNRRTQKSTSQGLNFFALKKN